MFRFCSHYQNAKWYKNYCLELDSDLPAYELGELSGCELAGRLE